jgi:hypothetical protein
MPQIYPQPLEQSADHYADLFLRSIGVPTRVTARSRSAASVSRRETRRARRA